MNAETIPLSPKQEAIARRVAELVVPVKPGPILTLAEAITYTKHGSDTAFRRWCNANGVRACGKGRYSRRWLDRGLEREAAKGNGRRAA